MCQPTDGSEILICDENRFHFRLPTPRLLLAYHAACDYMRILHWTRSRGKIRAWGGMFGRVNNGEGKAPTRETALEANGGWRDVLHPACYAVASKLFNTFSSYLSFYFVTKVARTRFSYKFMLIFGLADT